MCIVAHRWCVPPVLAIHAFSAVYAARASLEGCVSLKQIAKDVMHVTV